MEIFDVNTFPYWEIEAAEIEKRKKGNPRSRRGLRYKTMLSGFDIETSRLPDRDESYMYIWQWYFEGVGTVIGRTWGEYQAAVDRILDALGECGLVVLVHNLSYERPSCVQSTNGNRRTCLQSGRVTLLRRS